MTIEGKEAYDVKDRTGSFTSSGCNVYLRSISYIFGDKNGPNTEMLVGKQAFAFSVKLPNKLPVSVKSTYGGTSYTIDATLEVSYGSNMNQNIMFDINQLDVLNTYPKLREKVEIKTLAIGCEIKISLPKTGYGMGETIPIAIELISNDSSVIDRTIIKLMKVEKYKGMLEQKPDKIFFKTCPGVSARSSIRFEKNILIPANSPFSNESLKIYHLSYFIKVSLIKYYWIRKSFTIPIVIARGGLSNANNSMTPVTPVTVAAAPEEIFEPPSASGEDLRK